MVGDGIVLAEPTYYDVIILGGGAAGLFCAASAGRRGRKVLVLERANKVGKKILMSGGGRCNFTNLQVEAENFISGNPHFCKSALNRYTQWDFIRMVERYGIDYEERKHGQLFCKDSAKEILAMLLQECEQVGASIATQCEVREIQPVMDDFKPDSIDAHKRAVNEPRGRYRLEIELGPTDTRKQSSLVCQSLVIATGALSIPTLGGSGKGYDVAAQFSLPLIERRAGLVPFMFSDSMRAMCERLSGVSLEVEVSCQGQSFAEKMLFTHRGISGPAILQVSNYWRPGDTVCINLLPDLNGSQWLLAAKREQGNILLRTLLNQKLTKALVAELQTLCWPHEAELKLSGFSDKRLLELAELIGAWKLKPSATEGYRTAEVTLGGVDTRAISSRTMEATTRQGLYFIGEVVDVTGHLGGYNFQWAWSSGYAAGLFV